MLLGRQGSNQQEDLGKLLLISPFQFALVIRRISVSFESALIDQRNINFRDTIVTCEVTESDRSIVSGQKEVLRYHLCFKREAIHLFRKVPSWIIIAIFEL